MIYLNVAVWSRDKMQYLPPLDDYENDDIQFLRMNTPSWNPKINELRELMQSIRKKEVSMIITTKEG